MREDSWPPPSRTFFYSKRDSKGSFLATYIIAQADPLRYLISKTHLSGRTVNWVMSSDEFDLMFVKAKVIKGYFITDMLVEAPSDFCAPALEEFLNEFIYFVKYKIEEDPT